MRAIGNVIVVVLVGGCGRSGFDALGGDAAVAPDDASTDARAPAPWEGDFTLDEPELVPALNSDGAEAECFFATDTTLWFQSTRVGGSGGADAYQATRDAVGAPWGDVIELTGINTPALDGRLVTPTPGALVAYLHSDRMPNQGGSDIWTLARADADAPFDSADIVNLGPINSAGADFDPWVSADDARLYFVIPDLPDAPGGQDIVMAQRPAPGDPHDPPAPLAGLNSPMDDDNPALSPDERFVIFGSSRTEGGLGGKDLWYARRDDRDAPFSAPQPLPVVNSTSDDWEACFNEHGELYFASNRPGGMGQNDIYMTRFVPLD
ncbi:MAG TPA: hypothetical protein VMZ28_03435 [Kofleriaceae bacterium]|nr:hypothetical protein [Kofleriaceae bacterium]